VKEQDQKEERLRPSPFSIANVELKQTSNLNSPGPVVTCTESWRGHPATKFDRYSRTEKASSDSRLILSPRQSPAEDNQHQSKLFIWVRSSMRKGGMRDLGNRLSNEK
jgi:hypothetical protein